MKNKLIASISIFICYLLAFLSAWLTVQLLTLDSVITETLIADFVATTVVFAFSVAYRNASFYDPYWSVAPMVIALYWKYQIGRPAWSMTESITLAVVFFWTLRLTSNWYRSGAGLKREDWRYTNLRKQTSLFYPIVNYLGIHMFPTLIVFVGCLPLAVFFQDGLAFSKMPVLYNLLFVTGVVIGIAAPIIEFVADEQMRTHKETPNRTHIDIGLWRYSRHPNYFGEILFWVALSLIGFSTSSMLWWIGVGPVAMILLFLLASIPMMEKRMTMKYPKYSNYRRQVSMLFPWFRKKYI